MSCRTSFCLNISFPAHLRYAAMYGAMSNWMSCGHRHVCLHRRKCILGSQEALVDTLYQAKKYPADTACMFASEDVHLGKPRSLSRHAVSGKKMSGGHGMYVCIGGCAFGEAKKPQETRCIRQKMSGRTLIYHNLKICRLNFIMGIRKACTCDFAATTALELTQFHHSGYTLDYSVLTVSLRLVGSLEIDSEYAAECLPETGSE